ncbi:MAG: helix-turn-helix domain-containing protein [Dehalococcoidia bacterium]
MSETAGPEGAISVAEAARRMRRSIEQVRRYLREGKLKGERIGQQWFVDEASLGEPVFRYKRSPARSTGQVREVAAIMDSEAIAKSRIETLIREVEASREEMGRRLGGNVDISVVEMLQADRDER